MKISRILKEHKWAIILALTAVVITAYPQVYFRYEHRDVNQGIETMGAAEKMPRIREVMDGHSSLSSPYVKEGKDGPYLNNLLGVNIIGYLGKVLFLDFNNTILLSRWLFPFLLFLIIYGFVFSLSKDKLTALSASMMIFLGRILISPSGLSRLLSGEGFTGFLPFFRPVVSSLIALFFFSFLLFFWLFLEKKQYRYGILSAIVLGLTFYDYIYSWTFLYAFLGTFLLILLLQRKWQDFKRVIIVSLGGALLAVPYFLNLYQASLYSNYQEVSQRFGIIESQTLIFGFLIPSVLLIFLLFFPRKWRDRYSFCLALLVAPFVVLNQQLITGKIIQPGHYHWHFHIPLAIIFLLVIFFSWISAREWKLFKKLSAILIIGLSIYAGIFVQSSSYLATENENIEQQKYGPVMDWLNENGKKEEVVVANQRVSQLVVIYTPLNIFYLDGGSSVTSLAISDDRLINTLFSFYRLDGTGKDEAEELFFQDREKISHLVYGMYWRELAGNYGGIPDGIIQDILQKYQESFSIPTGVFLNELWSKYEVKYLVWDTKDDPQWQLDQYPFLKKVAEVGDFIIYQKI